MRTEIAHGTPKANMASAHGEPLGADALKAMREFYQWNEEPFAVPDDVKAYFAQLQAGYSKQHAYRCLRIIRKPTPNSTPNGLPGTKRSCRMR